MTIFKKLLQLNGVPEGYQHDLGGKCPIKEAEKKAVEEIRAAREKAKVESLTGRIGLPKRFSNADFDSYKETPENARALNVCKRYVERFGERHRVGGGLIMRGNVGTGKTHLACSIARAVAEKGYSVAFMTMYEFVDRVKATFDKNALIGKKELIDGLIEVDLLVVEEVGVQYGSDLEKVEFFGLMNGRYEEVKPTIITSNLDVEGVREYIGDRIYDRMLECGGVVLNFDWQSERSRIKTFDR